MAVGKILKVGRLPFTRRKVKSKYERLVSGALVAIVMVLVWTHETSGENQPNLTSVETWGETQIKVTWWPLEPGQGSKPYHHYELYIDDHLEYFGNDLMYIARRLTPDTIYHFKLRSCTQDTNQCSLFSKTLSGSTDRSQKRGSTKSFFQWTLLWFIVIILACTTALIGVRVSRKLWRSFLYRYDYRSDTDVGLPKYLAAPILLDDDTPSLVWERSLPETNQKTKTRILHRNSCKERTQQKKFQENEPLASTGSDRQRNTLSNYCGGKNYTPGELNISRKSDVNDKDLSKNNASSKNADFSKNNDHFANTENTRTNADISKNEQLHMTDDHSKIEDYSVSDKFSKNSETFSEGHFEKSEKFRSGVDIPQTKQSQKNTERIYNDDESILRQPSSPMLTGVENFPHMNKQKPNSFCDKVDPQAQNFQHIHNSTNAAHDLASFEGKTVRETGGQIVVLVDNSNIFIGAQECASLVNPRERRRHIRVKIQQLTKVLERGRTVSRAFVQGSSPPTTEQVWEVYRRLGYCVDLEDRRGKDEQRVDEGLHLHIYKALCELSARKLVIASGDGNRGKSEGATSFPGCAQAALEKGWLVEVHSWKHSLSTEWLKLSRKYPAQLSIHYLDRYINHITFVDGKNGRKCQPLPTEFFKRAA